MAGHFRILSLDGGGIRGVITAQVLEEIEHRSGKSISSLFDLIIGTSTGGILALGLVVQDEHGLPKLSAGELVKLYTEHGKEIFKRSRWHELTSADSLLDEKYQAKELERLLGERFGDAMLSQALTDVVVSSYDIEVRNSWFFRSRVAKLQDDHDFKMRDVARATSAAPTYFEPLKLKAEGAPDYWALIDGGVVANNPTMCGIAEAVGEYGKSPEDLVVVSIGTGSQTRRIPYDKARDWGVLGWARPILDVVFDGMSDTVHYQAQQMCGAFGGQRRYFRLQTFLNAAKDEMDDASDDNIHALKVDAARLIGDQVGDIDALIAAVTAPEPVAV